MTVLTTLLTSTPDPQRGEALAADASTFAELEASVVLHGWPMVVLADEAKERGWRRGVQAAITRVDALGINPYLARWQHYYDWLDQADPNDMVWCVDATDVEMLHDPGIDMQPGVLYVGSEPATVGLPWLRDNHPSIYEWADRNRDRTLLNAGIVGSERDTLMEFVGELLVTLDEADATDMGTFNRVAWSNWSGRLVFGERVHTVFRSEDRGNNFAWWRHK